jgi:hypothetical protein
MPMSRKSKRASSRKSKKSKSASNYKVQSIVVPKSVMTKEYAKKWIKKHYKLGKCEETAHTWRFRQIAPETVEKQGYTHYKNKVLPNGVELVLAYKHPRKP